MATTLTSLVTRLRQRTDTVSSQHVTDSELEGCLNESLAELYDILVESYEDYNVTTAAATVTSSVDGSNYFALPTDFHKMRGVDRLVGAVYMPLERFEFAQRASFGPPLTVYAGVITSSRYHILGGNCWIQPYSNAAGTYRVWYVPAYAILTTSDNLPAYMDTFANAWHAYAIADSAIKIMGKQQLDPSVFMQQKAELRQRIIDAAKPRDAGPPKRMVDTRNTFTSDEFGRWWR